MNFHSASITLQVTQTSSLGWLWLHHEEIDIVELENESG